LRIVGGSASGRELSVAAAFEIGRDPTAGLSLPDDGLVSQHHARVTPTDDGLVLDDLGSRNGTFVNGAQITGPTLLAPGDRVDVGDTTIQVEREVENEVEAERSQPAGQYLLLVSSRGGPADEVPLGKALEVGRDPAAGIPLPDDAQVSWHHARLSPGPDGVVVEDLESSNGTFADGVRIVGTTVVASGSRLIVGETAIEVVAVAPGRVDTAAVPSFLSADTVASRPAPVRQLVLEVVGPDGTARELPLTGALEVGRDPAAGLVLDDQLVSRLHVRLTPETEQLTVEDLGSRNGTFVNDAPIEAPTAVHPGDRVVVGETTIVVGLTVATAPEQDAPNDEAAPPEPPAGPPEPPAPELIVQVIEGWAAGRRFPLAGPLEVGRDPSAGVPLVEDERVSHRHARLTPSGEGVFVEDLGSTGGTFVNDRRIDERTLVVVGDRILVGSTVFRILLAAGSTAGLPA
jgi:pSer/pThr/pTyr-binding forkhead associated (FHA) protein